MTYLKGVSPDQLRRFSQDTLSELILPLEKVADEIQEARKATKQSTVWCLTDPRDLEPFRARLVAVSSDARLKRIPTTHEKRYHDLLLATQDLYYSAGYIHDIYSAESVSFRKKAYKKSLKEWKEARKRLQRARDYFEKASAPNYRPSAG